MSQVVQFITNLFRFHKLKFFAVAMFALFFGLIRFPYDDLSDLISSKISEATAGVWYLQFDRLNLAFLPPGLQMENVLIESARLPTVNAASLKISPWIMGALTAKKGVSVDAEGVFKGHLVLSFKEGETLKSGDRMQNIDVQANRVALPNLSEFLRDGNMLSLAMQGAMDMTSQLAIDPLFDSQPKGNVGIKIGGFSLPSQSFNTQMGPLQTPTLKLGNVNLQTKMGDGKLEIEEMNFGTTKDDMNGKLRGELGLTMRRDASGVRPTIGGYDLRIDMTIRKAFMETASKSGAGLAFVMVEKFKSETPQGTRFHFRVKAANAMAPPEFLPPQ